MKTSRRDFLKKSLATSLFLATEHIGPEQAFAHKQTAQSIEKGVGYTTINSINDNKVEIYSQNITRTIKLFLIADTHLWMSDSREDPYRHLCIDYS